MCLRFSMMYKRILAAKISATATCLNGYHLSARDIVKCTSVFTNTGIISVSSYS